MSEIDLPEINGWSETRLPYRSLTRTDLHVIRCHPLFEVEARPENLRQWAALIGRRLAQSFRLMVGVQDYGNYVKHMKQYHPLRQPMSEKEFHRYCLNARFPSEAGKLGKCPC